MNYDYKKHSSSLYDTLSGKQFKFPSYNPNKTLYDSPGGFFGPQAYEQQQAIAQKRRKEQAQANDWLIAQELQRQQKNKIDEQKKMKQQDIIKQQQRELRDIEQKRQQNQPSNPAVNTFVQNFSDQNRNARKANLNNWKTKKQFNAIQKRKGLKTNQAVEADRFVTLNNQQMHGNSKDEIVNSISQKILSAQRIEQEVLKMKKMLFYEPSQAFYQAIKKKFPQAPVDEVIYSAVVFKKQHLLQIQSQIDSVKKLYKYVRAWGKYLFDLNDLHRYATQNRGNALTGIYQLKAWNLEVVVSQNDINVKYDGKVLQPQEFQWIYLRPKAIERLKDHAKQVYVKFMKTKI